MIIPYNKCVLIKREKSEEKYFTVQPENSGIVVATDEESEVLFKEGIKIYFTKIVGEVGELLLVKQEDIIAYERN